MTIVSTNPCYEKQPYAWSKCEEQMRGRLVVGPRYRDGEKEALVMASIRMYVWMDTGTGTKPVKENSLGLGV